MSGGPAGVSGAPAAAGSGGETPPGPIVEIITEPMDEAAYVFDQTKVRSYNIVIASADLAKIDAKPSAEQWVQASLELEGKTYGPLMIRYKGSLGSFKSPCTTGGLEDPKSGKCSIKVGFDEVDPEARFFGLKKINFHALNPDRSYLRDRLGYSLFRESGIAAPRAMHVRLSINGKLEGLFIAVEQVDGRFARARFTEGGEGNVYKESWVTMDDEQDYIDALESNTDAPNVAGMLEFQRAVQTSSSAVEAFVDRAYMMRYVAVDRVIINDDGVFHFYCDANSANYPGTSHNFYWYQAEQANKFWLIPWDLDMAFDGTPWVRVQPKWDAKATCSCVKPAMYDPQWPPSCDGMVQHFIAWHDDYDREVDAFIKGPFSAARVEEKLSTWTQQLEPFVAETGGVKQAPDVGAWQTAVMDLRKKIDSARQNRGLKY